jgi:hypothetical protein
MTPNEPITPATPAASNAIPQKVAQQATQQTPPVVQSVSREKPAIIKRLDTQGIERVAVGRYTVQPTETEIIAKLAGADKTGGSCSSVALAYCGNKNGIDVTDFRGGMSRRAFSAFNNIKEIAKLDGVDGQIVSGSNDFSNAHKLLKFVQDGKEYYFTAGKHAAIVRKSATGIEYLEMQSGIRPNTWYDLTDTELKRRFGCQKRHTTFGMAYDVEECIFDVKSVNGNKDFEELLEFINTEPSKQRKGIGGGEK